jgi:hypothetical protein
VFVFSPLLGRGIFYFFHPQNVSHGRQNVIGGISENFEKFENFEKMLQSNSVCVGD